MIRWMPEAGELGGLESSSLSSPAVERTASDSSPEVTLKTGGDHQGFVVIVLWVLGRFVWFCFVSLRFLF